MKKIGYGILFLNLFSLNVSFAMEPNELEPAAKKRKLEIQSGATNYEEFDEYWKEFDAATTIQRNWRGNRDRKQAANLWVEAITSKALKDLLTGKLDLKGMIDQISRAPRALQPFITEKVMILIVKNIAFNADIKARFSPEFFADFYAVIEGLFEGYGQDHLLYALKREFVDGPRNTPLTKEIHILAASSKDLVMHLVEQFKVVYNDRSQMLKIFGILDKTVDEIMSQLMKNAESISDKSLSQEFKGLLIQFRENHKLLTMMLKAFIFKNFSEGILSAGVKKLPDIFGASERHDVTFA